MPPLEGTAYVTKLCLSTLLGQVGRKNGTIWNATTEAGTLKDELRCETPDIPG